MAIKESGEGYLEEEASGEGYLEEEASGEGYFEEEDSGEGYLEEEASGEGYPDCAPINITIDHYHVEIKTGTHKMYKNSTQPCN